MIGRGSVSGELVEVWRQAGLIPGGEFGERAVEKALSGIAAIIEGIPEARTEEISVEVGGLTIRGAVPLAQGGDGESVLMVDASDAKPARQLATWIHALLASEAKGQVVPGDLYGIKKKPL